MKHELVQLAGKVDWTSIHEEKGHPRIESRFVIGLPLFKHMFGLSNCPRQQGIRRATAKAGNSAR